jgi:hypothetical protein
MDDQGYYVPSENGTFVGRKFYSYNSGGNAFNHFYRINILSYSNNTKASLIDLTTNAVLWSGILNEGNVFTYSLQADTYFKVVSDKNVAVSAAPAFVPCYIHCIFLTDSTGKGVGRLFYHPALNSSGSSINNNLIIFAHENRSQVSVNRMDTGTVLWSGILNAGESHKLEGVGAVLKIVSNRSVSAVYDYGDSAGADYAPLYYAAVDNPKPQPSPPPPTPSPPPPLPPPPPTPPPPSMPVLAPIEMPASMPLQTPLIQPMMNPLLQGMVQPQLMLNTMLQPMVNTISMPNFVGLVTAIGLMNTIKIKRKMRALRVVLKTKQEKRIWNTIGE